MIEPSSSIEHSIIPKDHSTIQERFNVLKKLSRVMDIEIKPQLRDDPHFWFIVARIYDDQRRIIPKELDYKIQWETNLKNTRKLAIKNAIKWASEKYWLQQEAALDGLTGAFNRRALDSYLLNLLSHRRRGKADALVLFDIDHFRDFNNKYGHFVGDTVLKKLVALTRSKIRGYDFLARYGGEEFALVFPEVDINDINGENQMLERVEALRIAVEQELKGTIRGPEGESIDDAISASFGVKLIGDDIIINTKDDLNKKIYQTVDRYLYYAKTSGRNAIFDRNGKYPRK